MRLFWYYNPKVESMLSAGRFNVLCALGPSLAKAALSLTVIAAAFPVQVHAVSKTRAQNFNGNDDDIFQMMADKARDAMHTFKPDPALEVDPRRLYDMASKEVHDLISKVPFTYMHVRKMLSPYEKGKVLLRIVIKIVRKGCCWTGRLRFHDGLLIGVLLKKGEL